MTIYSAAMLIEIARKKKSQTVQPQSPAQASASAAKPDLAFATTESR